MSTIAAAPWFSRVWVIQEVASGKRVRIRVGADEGSWELLRGLINFCTELVASDLRLRGDIRFGAMVPILWMDLLGLRASNTLETARLLTALSSFSATDPRDMAIAIYGIAGDFNPDLFTPDYRQSVGETYARFALAAIRSNHSLQILLSSAVGVGEGKPDGLPTWAPDLSNRHSNRAVNSLTTQGLPTLGPSLRIRDTATDWRILHVAGVSIAKVAAVMTTASVAEFLRARGGGSGQDLITELSQVRVCDLWAYVNDVRSWTLPFQGGPSARPLSKLTVTSFCHALVACRIPVRLSMIVALWYDQDPDLGAIGTSPEARDELARLRLDLPRDNQELSAAYISNGTVLLLMRLQARALFLSEEGDLGLCSPQTQPGDSVVALHGLDGLVVLRGVEGAAPDDRRYQVVGDCVFNSAGCEEILRQHQRDGEGSAEIAEGASDGTHTGSTEWFKLE
jgi:hypothetical protein